MYRRKQGENNSQSDSRRSAGPVQIEESNSHFGEEKSSELKTTLKPAPTKGDEDEKLSAEDEEIANAIEEEVRQSEKSQKRKNALSPKTSFLDYPENVKESVKMTSSVLVDSKGNVVEAQSPKKIILIFLGILLILIGFGLWGELDEDSPTKPPKKAKTARKKVEAAKA